MNCMSVACGLLAAVLPSLLPAQDHPEKKAEPPKGPSVHAPAPAEPRPNPQSGNSWFTATDLDMGTFFGHEEAVGVFRFKNPRDKEVAWTNLQGSCTCTRAVIRLGDRRYELTAKPERQLVRITRAAGGNESREPVQQILIEAGEAGEVEVHMDMHGVTGPKSANLDIHTTDDLLQQIKLKWQATGAQMFLISPADVNLNTMVWNDVKDFTVTVTSGLVKDFNILRMEPADTAFKVAYEKSMNGENAVWTIRGTYGPCEGEAPSGGILKFYTDIQGDSSFSIRVAATVKGPLELSPGGFLMFGRIQKGAGAQQSVVFTPNDGVDLQATKLTFEKLTMAQEFLTARSVVDAATKKLTVEVVVSDKAPLGLVRGELLVELNHPRIKEKRIQFNGFVR